MTKKMFIVVGVSGAGKSTTIGKYPGVVCSADTYFVKRGNGSYAFDPKLLGAAHGECKLLARKTCLRGAPVIIDNTNLSHRDIKPYIDMAERHGYEVVFVRITPDSYEDAFKRCIHNVPRHIHDRQIERFKALDLSAYGFDIIEVRT